MARRTTSRRQAPRYDAVRRLERIERGAAVFYEVSRQGKWIMVRSGHVGLPGQTRMREYPTAPAASVAMERLVEDRLKEGWTEPSAGPSGEAAEAEQEARAEAPAAGVREEGEAAAPAKGRRRARKTPSRKEPAKAKKKVSRPRRKKTG